MEKGKQTHAIIARVWQRERMGKKTMDEVGIDLLPSPWFVTTDKKRRPVKPAAGGERTLFGLLAL